MLAEIFRGIFDTDMTNTITVYEFLICVGSALVIGLILAVCYMYKTRYTKSFVATLALLPAIVCVVIMMVNGNVGAGVAVAGAFSLVRFRSRLGKGDWRNFFGNGNRTYSWNGIFGLWIPFRCSAWGRKRVV